MVLSSTTGPGWYGQLLTTPMLSSGLSYYCWQDPLYFTAGHPPFTAHQPQMRPVGVTSCVHSAPFMNFTHYLRDKLLHERLTACFKHGGTHAFAPCRCATSGKVGTTHTQESAASDRQ
jgi:hypothetical protein